MITDQVKQTKAYQVAGDNLPLSIWEDVAFLAAQNSVDLNTVTAVCEGSFIFGEPRTQLTIVASPSRAAFQSFRLHKIKAPINQLARFNDSGVPILYTSHEGLKKGDGILLEQVDSKYTHTGLHKTFKVMFTRAIYPGWYEVWLTPEALSN